MIAAEKIPHALDALQALVIRARFMAYQRDDHAVIADLLDSVELLPRLIACEEDRTERFRDVVKEASTRHGCAFALERFDGLARGV